MTDQPEQVDPDLNRLDAEYDEPVVMVIGGQPVTESELDAAVEQAARVHDAATTQAGQYTPGRGFPHAGVLAAAHILFQRLDHDQVAPAQLNQVASDMLTAALNATGLVVIHPSWLDRKLSQADHILGDAETHLAELRAHLATVKPVTFDSDGNPVTGP